MKHKQIINPAKVHSEKNFGAFYSTYYNRFVRYAFYYVNVRETAEDMTHDALLYYWNNKEKLSPETDVLGYMMLTIKNKCLNHLKHLQVETTYNKKCTDLHSWEIDAQIMTLENEAYSDIFTKDIMDIVNSSLSVLPNKHKRYLSLIALNTNLERKLQLN